MPCTKYPLPSCLVPFQCIFPSVHARRRLEARRCATPMERGLRKTRQHWKRIRTSSFPDFHWQSLANVVAVEKAGNSLFLAGAVRFSCCCWCSSCYCHCPLSTPVVVECSACVSQSVGPVCDQERFWSKKWKKNKKKNKRAKEVEEN